MTSTAPKTASAPKTSSAAKTPTGAKAATGAKARARSKTSAAVPPSEEAEPPAVVAARAARESVRALIEAEIRRQDAFPVARRTLQLLAEAVVEPAAAPPFYRIVDRTGSPRLCEDGPLTLETLFDELRERHGALFVPVPPKPVVVEPPEPTASEEIKAATVRFVETQSVLARSVMARSAARGRAAAATVSATWSETVSGVRHQFGDRPSPSPGSDTEPTLRERGSRIGTSFGDTARHAVGMAGARLSALAGGRTVASPMTAPQRGAPPRGPRLAGFVARAGDGLRRLRPDGGSVLTRPATLAGAGLLGSLLLVLVLVRGGGDGTVALEPNGEAPRQEAQATPAAPALPPQDQPAPGQASNPGNPGQAASPAMPAGIPVEEPSPPSPDETPPKPANGLAGKAEVIDTATLRVGGKLVRLFGVEWVRGGQPEELTRYLSGRPVSCQTVAGSEAYLCAVEGRDLSEVVLFNGGGRASSEATPDLVAAEDRARTERLGVWAR